MTEQSAAGRNRKKRQGDLIVPPTTTGPSSSKPRSNSVAEEPERVGPWAYALLMALAVLAFGPILQSDLLWSEYDNVERTPFLSMDDWEAAWRVDTIRREDPVTLTSYFAESYSPLPGPTTHRLINLVLHLIAALLLLKILESLKLRGAYASALIFALHPAVLQTLYWPGYRSELVGLVFILASLFFGIRNRDAKDFILALIFTSISVILHPAALVLPVILALAVFYQHRNARLRHYNHILPLACLALFAGVWTHAGRTAATVPGELSPLTQAGQNLYFYLRQALLPFDLRLFHPFSEGQSYNVGATSSLLAFLIFVPFYVLIALNYYKRWARGLFLGLSSFLLLLIYGILQTGRFIDGSPAKEEYGLYVALPALIALLVCSAAGFLGQNRAFGRFLWQAFFSLFLLVHVGLTASFSYALSDTPRVWQTMAAQWEDSWEPRAALIASVQAKDSDLLSEREVIRTLEQIVALNPERHKERIQLARRYRNANQHTNALREYRHVLREARPSEAFLKEAADFFDSLNLQWEANNVRERIDRASNPQK